MSDPFAIVKDSSIWVSSKEFSSADKLDGLIRIGTVLKALNDGKSNELRYLVEIQTHGDKVALNCRMMRRFGGVYNYEDYIFQGYKIDDKPDPVAFSEAKAGDQVLVCFVNGQGREGVILGGITHAARKTEIQAANGPQYKTEFNGVETFINKDGEIIVTFKGLPTNISKLNDTPSNKIPAAQYNKTIGSSFYKFDKAGSWIVSDNAIADKQSIKIDKGNGIIEIASGKISLKMTKASEAVSLTCKILDTTATDKVSTKTKESALDASVKASIKSPKVAIGKEGIELLDQLAKLVDALSKVTPISPLGPCTPLGATPEWPQVEEIKAKIKEITGSF